ncbi:MAG: hypothetical protein ACYS0K_15410, partial [Planctomycetota bacterium]
MLRFPIVAASATVIATVASVAETICVLPSVRPVPLTESAPPVRKLVPFTVTVVCDEPCFRV